MDPNADNTVASTAHISCRLENNQVGRLRQSWHSCHSSKQAEKVVNEAQVDGFVPQTQHVNLRIVS